MRRWWTEKVVMEVKKRGGEGWRGSQGEEDEIETEMQERNEWKIAGLIRIGIKS